MDFDLTAEQEASRRTARVFAERSVRGAAEAMDATGRFPAALFGEAAALGLLGAAVPRAEGGAGRDAVSLALALEALAAASATFGMVVALHNALAAGLVARFGPAAARRRWLARLAAGEVVGSCGLLCGGVDADADEGVRAAPDGAGWTLRGRAAWMANASAAGLFVVFAQSEAGADGPGASAFLAPGDAPGLARTRARDTLGLRGLACADVVLEDVRVGADARLGASGGGDAVRAWARDGVRVAAGAVALGIAQAAFDEALAGGPRRGVEPVLADAATDLDAARLLVVQAAAARDRGEACPQESAMAALAATRAAQRAADGALRLAGAAGCERGAAAERLLRDARAVEVWHGGAAAQRAAIARELLGDAAGRPAASA